MGVYSTKMLGAEGSAISVSEMFGKGIGTGPSRQTSGNPKFMTIILFANITVASHFLLIQRSF
jgi:hypothetical protein